MRENAGGTRSLTGCFDLSDPIYTAYDISGNNCSSARVYNFRSRQVWFSPGRTQQMAKVSHMVLPVSDVHKSRDWYVDKLGFKVEREDEEVWGSKINQV